MTRSCCLTITAIVLSCVTFPASAHDSDEITALRAQLSALTERLQALESRAGHDTPEISATASDRVTAKSESAAVRLSKDRIRINADLRYRHELIDEDGDSERTRQRVRARVGIAAEVSDKVGLTVQLASGSDDPVSTNQTLGDAGSTKALGLNLAQIDVALTQRAKLVAGKMKNPLYRVSGSSLIFDSDLNPEGLAWRYSNGGFFANAAGFWLEERKSSSDALMLGMQSGFTTNVFDDAELTLGAGYYDYAATMGHLPFYDGEPRGNTLDANGNLMYDYNLLEAFAQLSTRLADMPISLFADWVRNTQAGAADAGTAIGFRLGKASAPGSWDVGYTYRDLEADAVIATFSDSDIGGGGTAVSGHTMNFAYAFNKRVAAQLTYILSKNQIDTSAERDYSRIQADFSVKY